MPDEPIPLMLDKLTTSFTPNIRGVSELIGKVQIAECTSIQGDIYLNDLGDTSHKYPALPYALGDVVKLIGIEEAMKAGGSNVLAKNQTLQRIILRGLSLNLEDYVKSTANMEGLAKFSDYQQFYNKYLTSMRELEKQIIGADSALPNLAGSLLMAFDEAALSIKTTTPIPKFSQKADVWRERIRGYYAKSSEPPHLSPQDFATTTFIPPVERVRVDFLKTIPKDFVEQVVE